MKLHVCKYKPYSSFRGDPLRHRQRPRSKTTDSWRLKTISPEPRSWRWRRRTKRERTIKVGHCCNIRLRALCVRTECVNNIFVLFYITDGWESASISDDDEDGEWVDVHHSSDEDTGEVVSLKK